MLALLFFILLLLQLSFIMSLLHVLSSILIVEVGLCKPEGQAMLSGFISLQDLCSFLKKPLFVIMLKSNSSASAV